MKFAIALIWVLLFGACSTLNVNQNAVVKACKNGVSTYDDGSTNFTCKDDFPRKDSPHSEGRK